MRSLALALGIAIGALCTSEAAAQTTQDNLSKYWALRNRATTDFIRPGVGAGDSIPATYRNHAFSFIKWSDGTVQLGWYLGVLASEYHLLSRSTSYPGYDSGDTTATTRTLDELYAALKAAERVDQIAETAFPLCLSIPWLNGFFIRDDVPSGYHQFFPGMSSVQSDFLDINTYNKEMSQDQAYHLMLGFALVKHLVPPGTLVQGRDLRQWAVDQGLRMMAHVAADSWQIHNPLCNNKLVDRGADARPMSKGANATVRYLSDGAVSHPVSALWAPLWDALSSPANPGFLNVDNLHMAMVVATVGQGFGSGTLDDLVALAGLQDFYLYPLAHAVLWNPATLPTWSNHQGALNTKARGFLDELPIGQYPASPRPAGPNPHGWSTENRFIRAKSRHYSGADGSDGQHYHGLDYQLLHNLYAIASPSTWELTGDPGTGGAGGAPASGGFGGSVGGSTSSGGTGGWASVGGSTSSGGTSFGGFGGFATGGSPASSGGSSWGGGSSAGSGGLATGGSPASTGGFSWGGGSSAGMGGSAFGGSSGVGGSSAGGGSSIGGAGGFTAGGSSSGGWGGFASAGSPASAGGSGGHGYDHRLSDRPGDSQDQ